MDTYGLWAIPLVALTAFVVGYTVSRAHLSQSQDRQIVPEDYNLVIPHQAEM